MKGKEDFAWKGKQMVDFEEEDDIYESFPKSKPFWSCEECGYESHTKPMPKDREKFYAKVHATQGPTCPKCKSEGSFMPRGF